MLPNKGMCSRFMTKECIKSLRVLTSNLKRNLCVLFCNKSEVLTERCSPRWSQESGFEWWRECASFCPRTGVSNTTLSVMFDARVLIRHFLSPFLLFLDTLTWGWKEKRLYFLQISLLRYQETRSPLIPRIFTAENSLVSPAETCFFKGKRIHLLREWLNFILDLSFL